MFIYISKLDSAKRQLEMAIKLYFGNHDPVSIHTLTCASYNILKGIGKKQNIKPIIKSTDYIKPGMEKRYLDIVSEAENFFKHGCKDSNKLLKFNPEITLTLIYDACQMYYKLTSEYTFLMTILKGWFSVNNLEVIKNGQYKKKIKLIKNISPTNRTDFYNKFKDLENHTTIKII